MAKGPLTRSVRRKRRKMQSRQSAYNWRKTAVGSSSEVKSRLMSPSEYKERFGIEMPDELKAKYQLTQAES